jgi:hypothetical protein
LVGDSHCGNVDSVDGTLCVLHGPVPHTRRLTQQRLGVIQVLLTVGSDCTVALMPF